MTATQIVIAGGGIGGLAAAIALSRFGVSVLVVERADAPYELGNGLQLAPNAMRILSRLGLAQVLEPDLSEPETLEIRSAGNAARLASMPLGRAARARYGAPYCTISRRALHRALSEQAKRSDVTIRYAATIAGYRPTGDGVEISIDGGETLVAHGLVGADGLWSTIRKQITGGAEPANVGHIAWRTVLAMTEAPELLRDNRVGAWLGPRIHAVHYPIDGGRTLNLVVVAEGQWTGQGWEETADQDALKDAATTLASPLGELILAAGDWRRWPLFETRPPVTAGLGPVTLLGDAAHPMLPYAAQGAGMAIEDAAVLADALAAAPGDVAGAFRAYEQARRARVLRVLAGSRRNGRIFHLDGAMRIARDAALRALPGRALLSRYDWLYGGAPA